MARCPPPRQASTAPDGQDRLAPQDRVEHDATLATRPLPTSNWGLTIARQSNSGAVQASTAGRIFVSEMNETSMTTSSAGYEGVGKSATPRGR